MAETDGAKDNGTISVKPKSMLQRLNNPLTYLICAWMALGIVLTVVLKALDVHNPWGNAWTVPNFLILASFLWYFARKPLKDFLEARRAAIIEGLERAEKMKTEAEARHKEYQARLDNIDKEIERLRQMAAEEAKLESSKIIEEAQRQAERIRNEAQFTAQQEVKKAQAMLRAETAALAVELAEKLLRDNIRDEDRKRLLEEYLNRVEAVQ